MQQEVDQLEEEGEQQERAAHCEAVDEAQVVDVVSIAWIESKIDPSRTCTVSPG